MLDSGDSDGGQDGMFRPVSSMMKMRRDSGMLDKTRNIEFERPVSFQALQ